MEEKKVSEYNWGDILLTKKMGDLLRILTEMMDNQAIADSILDGLNMCRHSATVSIEADIGSCNNSSEEISLDSYVQNLI